CNEAGAEIVFACVSATLAAIWNPQAGSPLTLRTLPFTGVEALKGRYSEECPHCASTAVDKGNAVFGVRNPRQCLRHGQRTNGSARSNRHISSRSSKIHINTASSEFSILQIRCPAHFLNAAARPRAVLWLSLGIKQNFPSSKIIARGSRLDRRAIPPKPTKRTA